MHATQTIPCEACNASITRWIDLNETHAIFRIRPDSAPAPAFIPGQYATLGLPRNHPPVERADRYPPGDPRGQHLIRRPYSIASAASERDELGFYAVRVPGGRLAPKLWNLKEGGRVWLDERIRGDFTLESVPEDKDLVMVATGTGLAPYVSMLRTYRGTERWRRFVVIHGVRYASDLSFRDVLERAAAEDPSVVYVPICSREPAGSAWYGLRGRCTALLHEDEYARHVGAALTPDDSHVYLCGSPYMIDDAERILQARGFVTRTPKQPGNLHFERYW